MLSLDVTMEQWPLRAPFRITGYTFSDTEVIVVTLRQKGVEGRGEAAGVYYRGETPDRMIRQIEEFRGRIEQGIDRHTLRELMPPGGARNALDCALWDLEANQTGIPAWRLAGLSSLKPLETTYTISADTPALMGERAKAYAPAPRLKLKLTGEDDIARVAAVRGARPDAWIGVDANQAFTRQSLLDLLPALVTLDVRLIEQPVPIGQERELENLRSPIPLAADESVQSFAALAGLEGLFDIVNIKLDKCGGLTEALLMIAEIRRLGMTPMVGCMAGTSLSMAAGCIAGQLCDFIDLDSPLFLARDRAQSLTYKDGVILPAQAGWGFPVRDARPLPRQASR